MRVAGAAAKIGPSVSCLLGPCPLPPQLHLHPACIDPAYIFDVLTTSFSILSSFIALMLLFSAILERMRAELPEEEPTLASEVDWLSPDFEPRKILNFFSLSPSFSPLFFSPFFRSTEISSRINLKTGSLPARRREVRHGRRRR